MTEEFEARKAALEHAMSTPVLTSVVNATGHRKTEAEKRIEIAEQYADSLLGRVRVKAEDRPTANAA